jgi:KDO2-lipid IV(A) lauroyltransferase
MKRARESLRHAGFIHWIEYVAAYCALYVVEAIPLKLGYLLARTGGVLIYYFVPRRRRIALDNLRHVFAGRKNERDIRKLARQSCCSFAASLFEICKFRVLLRSENGLTRTGQPRSVVQALFEKARTIHERAGGCVFVTAHIGTWEFLPYASLNAGVPLVIVVRPLDNPYLERLLYEYRGASGQLILPKKNSLHILQTALRQGKSVALLPDQSTMKAITVEYMGRKATVTPIPALLAVLYNRPIVVVACCRVAMDFRFEGIVSDPIWPVAGGNEKDEIFRLTRAMNLEIEKIVYKYPEQYLWMHDRWKRYSSTGELFPG